MKLKESVDKYFDDHILEEGAFKEMMIDEPEFDVLFTDWINKKKEKGRGEQDVDQTTKKTTLIKHQQNS